MQLVGSISLWPHCKHWGVGHSRFFCPLYQALQAWTGGELFIMLTEIKWILYTVHEISVLYSHVRHCTVDFTVNVRCYLLHQICSGINETHDILMTTKLFFINSQEFYGDYLAISPHAFSLGIPTCSRVSKENICFHLSQSTAMEEIADSTEGSQY